MISLSKRLHAVAEMAAGGNVTADIGCDHAHVSIYLIENHMTEHVIACDINRGPLEKADENIRQAGLSDCIELRLADGLSGIGRGETDTIVIAGMGGPLMKRILEDADDIITDGTVLVLSPQSDVGAFRRYLCSHGYCITDERLIYEDDKYYPIIKAIKGLPCNYSDECDFAYGRILLDCDSDVLLDFLKKEERITRDLLESLDKVQVNDRIADRIQELTEVLAVNLRAQKRLEGHYEM